MTKYADQGLRKNKDTIASSVKPEEDEVDGNFVEITSKKGRKQEREILEKTKS